MLQPRFEWKSLHELLRRWCSKLSLSSARKSCHRFPKRRWTQVWFGLCCEKLFVITFLFHRKASFVKSFNEEELKNEDIRYVFPEGCELPEQCSDTCCEQNRPQVFFPQIDSNSCCKNVSKLVLPIDLSELDNVAVAEITKITSEIDPVKMLLKLMRLIEKSRRWNKLN